MPDIGNIVLLAVAVVLVSIIAIRHPEKLRLFITNIRTQAGNVFITLPFGLLIAAFVSRMLPADLISALIGRESGLTGRAGRLRPWRLHTRRPYGRFSDCICDVRHGRRTCTDDRAPDELVRVHRPSNTDL